ncbi:MAG: CDP-diacylglycerol--glycerol-3-phosphate 3-phosphatidyltransferase [Proteobacteria bacterium]|nr:CDP-diacylglycerol--glycerol-3-phosphate 3-phosphatidyltransferase [Desulfobacteraceae bacterium]MBU4054530.1 CDP-diacylglycerol--glycerol-3-phosphate 3-phosphatidyltransferase [Pseudomonadota bacterium]MBU4316132.1 CDP-diacylglycerol--glycerol-3-phosphate 3-phosphatidyltransferase [Pseudomonadota bacterium]MBU4472189.1 CDP-diacylglycerol--glycerol-3-phosphate 3-phosphatidyltransferase [Pseudomonadota bacterium]MCG2750398.1 CDP-diacylglycerol--glycerol-3-phosphate 3-phosphatidyltransferase [
MKKMAISPNHLTLLRIASTPAIVLLLLIPNRLTAFLAAMIFSAAAITDYLDGYYARQMNMVSSLGKIMDPLADKLLVSSSFIMLTSLGWIPAWIVCIIIGRELAITGFRNILAEKGKDVSASELGKYKTGFQIAAIIPLMIHYSYLTIDFHAIGFFFLWGALVLTVWSAVDYFVRFRSLIDF